MCAVQEAPASPNRQPGRTKGAPSILWHASGVMGGRAGDGPAPAA